MCGGVQFSIAIGQVVPGFEMETFEPLKQDFGKISLDDIKAKHRWLILFFYPADFTFVCPTELADLASVHDALTNLGCEVVSVSTDTKFSHLAWHREEQLLKGVKYSMGSDPTGKVARLFGIYDDATGLALRGTFVISPDGKLAASEVNYYNVGRNAAELLRKMHANAYLLNHPAEACPARWNDGDQTLTPSAKLVGKVYENLKK